MTTQLDLSAAKQADCAVWIWMNRDKENMLIKSPWSWNWYEQVSILKEQKMLFTQWVEADVSVA